MEALKDPSHLLEFERLAHHAERPGFRITERLCCINQQ